MVVFTIVVLLVFLCGYSRWPTGPASGEGLSGELPRLTPARTSYRFATFNMHSGVGGDDVPNLGRTIDAVADTDFCALQEVRGYLYGPAANQAQELALATHRAWLFAPTERRYWHDEFGNALLSRLPVGDWTRIGLPIEPQHSGRRNMIIAVVKLGDLDVRVLAAHVDRDKDQTNQLQMVRRIYEALQSPSILLADLNAESKNPQVQAMLALPGVHDCIAETDADASAHDRIDWILERGLKPLKGGHVQNGASDHPLYWVDLGRAEGQ